MFGLNRKMIWVVARTDLKQLVTSKDYLLPLGVLGLLFFVIFPAAMLLSITVAGNGEGLGPLATLLDLLPPEAQAQIQGDTPAARTAYAVAVYVFAPMGVIVPLTISTAVGSATLVGEREKGTGEFLAHSPASARDIYVGKLLASLLPGYVALVVGFTLYSTVVNLIVGPEVGGWFFPTKEWLLLVFWVVPPFLAIALSIVLRLSARVKSTIAAQQSSALVTLPTIMIAYTQSTGSLVGVQISSVLLGAVAWVIAITALFRGTRSVKRGRLLTVADA